MSEQNVVVKRKFKVYCDCCGVTVRGQPKSNKYNTFEIYYREALKDGKWQRGKSYAFKDLCKLCHSKFSKMFDRTERFMSSRKRSVDVINKIRGGII